MPVTGIGNAPFNSIWPRAPRGLWASSTGPAAPAALNDWQFDPAPTTIEFRGATPTLVTVAATPWTVNAPTYAANGDLIIVVLMSSGATDSVTAFTGFTLLTTVTEPSDAVMHVYYAFSSGAEPSTYSVTFNTTTAGMAACLVYRNVDQTDPFSGTALTSTGASATAQDWGPYTPDASNSMVVALIGCDPAATGLAFNWDTGWKGRFGQSSGSAAHITAFDQLQTTATAVSPGGDFSAAEPSVQVVFSLNQVSGATNITWTAATSTYNSGTHAGAYGGAWTAASHTRSSATHTGQLGSAWTAASHTRSAGVSTTTFSSPATPATVTMNSGTHTGQLGVAWTTASHTRGAATSTTSMSQAWTASTVTFSSAANAVTAAASWTAGSGTWGSGNHEGQQVVAQDWTAASRVHGSGTHTGTAAGQWTASTKTHGSGDHAQSREWLAASHTRSAAPAVAKLDTGWTAGSGTWGSGNHTASVDNTQPWTAATITYNSATNVVAAVGAWTAASHTRDAAPSTVVASSPSTTASHTRGAAQSTTSITLQWNAATVVFNSGVHDFTGSTGGSGNEEATNRVRRRRRM